MVNPGYGAPPWPPLGSLVTSTTPSTGVKGEDMSVRRIIGVGAAVAALAVAGAAPAVAGEVNGNGKPLPLKGKSICKYSGLNDEVTPDEPTRTQSFGTFLVLIKKQMGGSPQDVIGTILPSPGDACNPTKGFVE